jgi:hypothetical protein
MALKPDIVHIVGHTEADHAATADEVIEAAKMARRTIENALNGQPAMIYDPIILNRKDNLVHEAKYTLQAIQSLCTDSRQDPLTNPNVLAKSVTLGILDAPQLKNNPFGRGEIRTRIINGACQAVDKDGNPISESQRLSKILHNGRVIND